MEIIAENKCFDGTQKIIRHQSAETGGMMRFSLYLPPAANDNNKVPVLWWLSGITCTEENFTIKAGAQRYAAEHGIAVVAPDTSPRNAGIANENDSDDFGVGAGFYIDATCPPWSQHYRMFSYISKELPAFVAAHFPLDRQRQSITGHSMGGHGALIIALKNPGVYRSVSAFAPICHPSACPRWQQTFTRYLGEEASLWRQWDATALVQDGARCPPILIDQGGGDPFLHDGLLSPDMLHDVCKAAEQPLDLRYRDGYDHGYYFISSFIGEHVARHARALTEK